MFSLRFALPIGMAKKCIFENLSRRRVFEKSIPSAAGDGGWWAGMVVSWWEGMVVSWWEGMVVVSWWEGMLVL